MKYNPNIHHRRSIRLRGYDYAQNGWYFVTICAHGRACLFGDVVDGVMRLNDAGRMVGLWLSKLPGKYPSIRIDSSIVMPNHIHVIVVLDAGDAGARTDAPLPDAADGGHGDAGDGDDTVDHDDHGSDNAMVGADPRVRTPHAHPPRAPTSGIDVPKMSPRHTPTVGQVMRWFKTMTTNAYIHGVRDCDWPAFDRRLWQRNYYEHIIRDQASLDRIRAYIASNPSRWEPDQLHPGNASKW
jgi:REP element-mobilizing transposase RayT